ncbi:MAG: hypothetical protein E7059_06575 [Treponema bryantii]|nr:hypothetical protein [Treponema bryantii]
MKKILTFLMIFVALFTFVACDNGNSSSGNGGNEIINPVAKEFADCTTDVDVENMVISDGSWTVIGIQQYTGMLRSLTLQATVKDNSFTYTSGTEAGIVDTSIMFEEEPELLDALRNAKNDEEKTAIMIELQGEMPEGATLTWDGLIATMTQPLAQEDLDEYSEDLQFSILPEFAVVKCNADKTKYVISITYESAGREVTETYYIEKN